MGSVRAAWEETGTEFTCTEMGLKGKCISPLFLQNIQDKYQCGMGLTLESKQHLLTHTDL